MTYRQSVSFIFVIALSLGLAACSDDTPTAPNSPTPVPPTVRTFEGTVNPNGAVTHDFATAASGTVTATLTTLTPEGLVIGLSLGTWNGSFCQVVLAKDSATQGAVVTGNVSALGNLCVRVYDVGNVKAAEPATYLLTVEHP
jgi:hypothetical protein